jgi:FlaA1/EpsC-like NDP-sugar epimerase
VDIDVIYTGLRPGEKIRENLISEFETLQPSSNSKVVRVVSSLPFSGAELRAGIRELEMDLRRRPVNLPAKLHALARIDREAPADTPSPAPAPRVDAG